jgi:1,4-dihydroxy-2-naphthoate polyprenyltransferase
MANTMLQSWLYAFRLRTLPLAFSAIITGSFLGYQSHFDSLIFGLAILTTLLLQILSNLANDYGDSQKGADNDERVGPKRAVQAGMLSMTQIKWGILICALLSVMAGVALVYVSLAGQALTALGFIILGLAAVAAAIKYTVGAGAYGYEGLGDVFVMVFFGWVGVVGSSYLQTHHLDWTLFLPAWTIGAFAAGVLNTNNMRDRVGDAHAGKNTLVVKLGAQRAKYYHTALIVSGWLCALMYVYLHFGGGLQLLFVISAPLFWRNVIAVHRITEPRDYDPLLKQLALSTFIFAILFALGQAASV